FREDLYYRLNVIPFHISPLRERKEDILSLSEYFLTDIAKHNKVKKKSLAPRALKKLEEYHWPGNIRELRNLIERFAVMTESTEIGERDIILSHGAGNKEVEINACDLKGARGEFEKKFIMEKLSECEGNISKTAKAIGLERSHLHRKIKQHNIKL
ncbi:MAG TPA: helix-turn-helix domain-containing protein, partial [Bdellovibrionota bacterium]|nr:helix-turn-helix domain-containing protein [Bdellovibrionota bacterium]